MLFRARSLSIATMVSASAFKQHQAVFIMANVLLLAFLGAGAASGSNSSAIAADNTTSSLEHVTGEQL